MLPAAAEVSVTAYDALGRRVAVLHVGPLTAGRHVLPLDGAGLPVGVYLLRASVRTNSRKSLVTTQRMTVAR